jgi:hypothetical protein
VPPVSTDLFEQLGVNGRDIMAGQASKHMLVTRPSHFKGLGWLARMDAGTVLLTVASVLLAANAAAMGIVSWHAQYAFVLAEKHHQHTASALEALGLNTAAVIFAIYGVALARLGRRALIERLLVVGCALGEGAMNLLAANLGSPRSIAVYVMPALLFAAGADRLIAVVRRAALGRQEDDDSQRSAWRIAGRALLYVLRFSVAAPSTAGGARRALLLATPLPPPERPAIEGPSPSPAVEASFVPGPDCVCPLPYAPGGPAPCAAAGRCMRPGSAGEPAKPREGTKTAALLQAADERYGPLADIPLDRASAIATELASDVNLHPGSARTALRAAILRAKDGAR